MTDVPRPGPEARVVSTASIEPTNPATAPWWKSVPGLIAVLAFVLSLVTSLIAAYTAHKKDVHDQQSELSAVVQKLLQIPVTQANLFASNQMGNLQPVFTEQLRMLTVQAYSLARSLGSNAPAPELMNVAPMLAGFQNYRAAKQIWHQATIVADNFSDEVSALRAYGIGMIMHAQSDVERTEGERALEAAMNLGSKYPDVARNPAEISHAHALTQLAWTDAWSGFDCTKAEFHLQEAHKFVQVALAGPMGAQVQSMAKAWQEALRYCDESKRLPLQVRLQMQAVGSSTSRLPNPSDQSAPLPQSPQLPPVLPPPAVKP